MGANTFTARAKGKTAKDAFLVATAAARHEHGHGGYTGSIAEKRSFTIIPLPDGMEATKYAEHLIDTDDARISDKWGPAGCLKMPDDDGWLFFGWASS